MSLRGQIAGCRVGSAKLATLDVKDFFLSGSLPDLISDCMFFYNGPHAALLREALFFLLDSQYVVPLGTHIGEDESPAVVHQCIEGSGMGLMHSGIIAILSFRKRVEIPLLENSQIE